MSAKDIERLEKNIERLREQIAGAQDAFVLAERLDKPRIKQVIGTLREELRDFEQEKWDLIAQITSTSDIANDEAEIVVAELIAEGDAIATNPPDDALVLELLQKILGKLNELDKPAAAKLKGAISALPPFVSLTYEAEMDTENTLRKYFPTFSTWTKNLASRLKK
jgi:cell division septum initiation protein DivIVA